MRLQIFIALFLALTVAYASRGMLKKANFSEKIIAVEPVLSETDSQTNYCYNDQLDTKLADDCTNLGTKCKICWTAEYQSKCLYNCGNGITPSTCTAANVGYCKTNLDLCQKCQSEWAQCQCPAGTSIKVNLDQSRKCVIDACPDGKFSPNPQCTACSDCDSRCSKCTSLTACQACTTGNCLWENLCYEPTANPCTAPRFKLKNNGDNCFTCVSADKCTPGTFPNTETRTCQTCPAGCTTCTSASVCLSCTAENCLFQNQCVPQGYQCPTGFKLQNTGDKCFTCVECEKCGILQWCDKVNKICSSDCTSPKFVFDKKCLTSCQPAQFLNTAGPQPNYYLSDLNFKTVNDAISGWTIIPATGAKLTTCGNQVLLGGFDLFGAGASVQRTVTGLPVHQKLKISWGFMKIDSWDGEQFKVLVDGKNVFQKSFTYAEGGQSCGQQHGGWNELYFQSEVTIDHTNDVANIQFTTSLDQGANDESWGINNVQIQALDINIELETFARPSDNAPPRTLCDKCDTCPDKTWCNSQTDVCDTKCDAPKFIYKRDCIATCPEGLYRQNNNCVKCEDCSSTTFCDNTLKQCTPCQAPCKTCANSATFCLFPCNVGFIWHSTGQCLENCPEQFFAYVSLDTKQLLCNKQVDNCMCGKCFDNCLTCTGSKNSNCITCKSQFNLAQDGQCLVNCPSGFYVETTVKQCHGCHSLCETCFGARVDQCITCNSGATLSGNTCSTTATVSSFAKQIK